MTMGYENPLYGKTVIGQWGVFPQGRLPGAFIWVFSTLAQAREEAYKIAKEYKVDVVVAQIEAFMEHAIVVSEKEVEG